MSCLTVLTVQAPLTRCGEGPGLILVVPAIDPEDGASDRTTPDPEDRASNRTTLDPEPMQKWAEEGFTVAQLEVGLTRREPLPRRPLKSGPWMLAKWDAIELARAVEALDKHEKCTNKDKYGLIFYLPRYGPVYAPEVLDLQENYRIGVVISNQKSLDFRLVSGGNEMIPSVYHVENWIPGIEREGLKVVYQYNGVTSEFFHRPSHEDYSPASAAVAHTRSLTALKKALGGPYFDLEEIWDKHTLFEFGERSVEETMNSMVAEPYVNHVPTMTGGIGRKALSIFYATHFIQNNPEDTALDLVSRTVGVDRVVDEFIFSLTHDRVIDWLAPGVPPTGKKLRIPFTAVATFRGEKLCHEHIAWDQLTVLIQMGLMPEYLPFPYPLPNGQLKGKQLEYRVPGGGHEVADKLLDASSQPSNEMLLCSVRVADAEQDNRPAKRVRA